VSYSHWEYSVFELIGAEKMIAIARPVAKQFKITSFLQEASKILAPSNQKITK
jgi:hypothetical protein